jgi:hypothetical protein
VQIGRGIDALEAEVNAFRQAVQEAAHVHE